MSTELSLAEFKERFKNEPPSEYRTSPSFEIVPTIAFIQGTPVYSLTASLGMRYVFTGGEDGFVRKYDFLSSINGTQLLTASQRHLLPDTITKSGVLSAYWENEQPLHKEEYNVANDGTYIPKMSPVYSLAAQAEALWVASGLQSGGISFQSATYGELGQCLAYFDGHTKTVSDLKLNGAETSLLSGSWDRSIVLWDLNAGVQAQRYTELGSQVSCIDWQPLGAQAVMPPRLEKNNQNTKDDDDDDDDKSMESLFGSDDEVKKEELAKNRDNGDDQMEDAKEAMEINANITADEDLSEEKKNTGNIFISACYNGTIELWDLRQATRASWLAGSQAPPWCTSACFSYDGNKAFVGRRNACIEEYDLRRCDSPLRILKFPAISGAVSSLTPMPNNRSLLCASYDNIRMYDLETTRKTPFFIIPGHHGALVSRMIVDHSGKYLISACGGRGWVDAPSDVTLAYEISPE